jgi:hypothetical protein
MNKAWKDLDRILRGEATRMADLCRGEVEFGVKGVYVLLVGLAMGYGVCMGTFSLFKETNGSGWPIVAGLLKVPALFTLTLLVTFPSLYVANALVGSRLEVGPMIRLLTASLAITTAVLASLGPIVAFFSVSTTSYPFMVLLNVATFAVSGGLGLAFLLQTLHRLSLTRPLPVPVETIDTVGDEKTGAGVGPLDHVNEQVMARHVKQVFRCWVVLFGLVGAQMGWVLRPFIGDPGQPFAWFRPRDSNFFQAVWNAIGGLFS